MTEPHGSLPRLGPEAYRGLACVHWSMTIDDRKTGWLKPIFSVISRRALAHGFPSPPATAPGTGR